MILFDTLTRTKFSLNMADNKINYEVEQEFLRLSKEFNDGLADLAQLAVDLEKVKKELESERHMNKITKELINIMKTHNDKSGGNY